jgi:hypothetical protein
VLPDGELNFIEIFGAGGGGEREEEKTNFENSMNRGRLWRLIVCLSEGQGRHGGLIRMRKRTGNGYRNVWLELVS